MSASRAAAHGDRASRGKLGSPAGTQPTTITGGMSIKGGIAGGTVGCNIQMSDFVIGGEADFSWTNKRGSANDRLPFDTTSVSTTREKWLDTFRGRFGYAIDRFMVYGTAGVAVAGNDVRCPIRPAALSPNARERTGWVVGARRRVRGVDRWLCST